MKLLVISNNPQRASFRQRIGIHLDALRSEGIEPQVVKYPESSRCRWKLLKSSREFDCVLLHKKTLNVFDAAVLRRQAARIVYDFDDAIMYRHDRPDKRPSFYKHVLPFARTVRMADVVIAGNDYLADHAARYNSRVEVLPTAVDTSRYRSRGAKTDSAVRLAWIGSSSTLPYLESIRSAIEGAAMACGNLTLRIICDRFFDAAGITVEKCSWSRRTEALDLSSCDIGLAPLPDNRFTRGKCGFKILQYQAAALPVIASPVGVNRQFVDEGVSGFFALDIPQWIDRLTMLAKTPELRISMGRAGRMHVKTVDAVPVGRKLCEIIKAGAALSPPAAGG